MGLFHHKSKSQPEPDQSLEDSSIAKQEVNDNIMQIEKSEDETHDNFAWTQGNAEAGAGQGAAYVAADEGGRGVAWSKPKQGEKDED